MWTVALLGAGPLVFGGVIAYLAGAAGLGELRRLRRVGVPVEALVKAPAAEPGERPVPLLQFATREGLIMEVFSPVPLGSDSHHVLIAYDPADPRQVVVSGRERFALEYAFLALGVLAVLTGLALLSVPG